MSRKLLQPIAIAVAAAACAMAGAQTVTAVSSAASAQGAATTAPAGASARFVAPRLVAGLSNPTRFDFSPAGFPAASLPSLSSSSSSFAAASAAALPPVSAQFESIFVVPCRAAASASATSGPEVDSDSADGQREPCVEAPNPQQYARFLDSPAPFPLTAQQKGWLAIHDVKDPGNLATIFATSAFTVGTNSHTAYGPGWAGVGRMSMYSLSQDATGEFFGTFAVPALAHQDPRYHRMPTASIPRRILHAVSHTVISQSDSGRPMPNFATLAVYPIATEISNLYVPGLQTDARSSVDRILTGYATDPVDNLITEFLPDVARHIHVRVIFAQRVLNQVSGDDFVLP